MKSNVTRMTVLIVILIISIVAEGLLLHMERRVAFQNAMRYQLQAVRISINLFKAIEKRNPSDIKELAMAHFRFPGESEQRRFLEGITVSPNGLALDPFGNPYIYDPVSGWVRSSTRGYLDW
jgi:hypothetical protein